MHKKSVLRIAITALAVSTVVVLGAFLAHAVELEINIPVREPNLSDVPARPLVTLENSSEEEPEGETLPASYCMRDEYIVYAQNQDKHGLCWNFASTMSASTTLMRATGEYYDFSELWNGITTYTYLDYYDKFGDGGNFSYQDEAMRKGGLMLEVDLPYQDSYTVSNENIADYYSFFSKDANLDVASTLKNVSYSRKNLDKIKEHIYNHGSLYLVFSFKQGYVADGDFASYLPPNQSNRPSTHAVSVIGWDDNYEKEIYLNGSDTPTVFKGAFIILNSFTEDSGIDGLSFVFYDDTNVHSTLEGYVYERDTERELYFYDHIEEGYEYPISVIGKYCGDFAATSGVSKQKNIFYDDVSLEYSYEISEGASISGIDIFLGDQNVTKDFAVTVKSDEKRFSITKEHADYGQYKVLVSYTNGEETGTYLNNFFVTHGLVGEEIELDTDKNDFTFNTGRDLEYYSFTFPEKNYVIYTGKTSGSLFFRSRRQSVYSEQNMSLPTLSYEIVDGKCVSTYSLISEAGYTLDYHFTFEYCEDTALRPITVYYDLGGGVNDERNYRRELAGEHTDIVLYAPTREGYTFDGWYLDYGNGSKKLEQNGDEYYVAWEDICHMGSSPTLYASSYYQKYYNNSGTVFLYAHWKEDTYCNVTLAISGEGTSTVGESVSVKKGETVRYFFKPEKSHCLSALRVNGTDLSVRELAQVVHCGLVIEADADTDIEASFSSGALLSIDVGENIKSAYLSVTVDGVERKFYDGDCVPGELLSENSVNYFDLIVLPYDDTETDTYIPSDVSSYTALEKGVFQKRVYIYRSSSIKEISVSGALPKQKASVSVSYTANAIVKQHYISHDKNATSGNTFSETFVTGDVAYVFILVPGDDVQYYYTVPLGFVSVGGGWYRKSYCITANAESMTISQISVGKYWQYYTVTWNNYDGTYITEEEYCYNDLPAYRYENEDGYLEYPTRAEDEYYTYVFAGWDKEIAYVVGDITYTAVFLPVPKQYTVSVTEAVGGSIIAPSEDGSINCHDKHTYLFLPDDGYDIKDVKINGVSVGAVSSYTFTDVCSDQTVSVEFEKKTFKIGISIEGEGSVSADQTLDLVPFGDSRTLTVTADSGWQVLYVFLDGERVFLDHGMLTVARVTQDINVSVVFEALTKPTPDEDETEKDESREDESLESESVESEDPESESREDESLDGEGAESDSAEWETQSSESTERDTQESDTQGAIVGDGKDGDGKDTSVYVILTAVSSAIALISVSCLALVSVRMKRSSRSGKQQ